MKNAEFRKHIFLKKKIEDLYDETDIAQGGGIFGKIYTILSEDLPDWITEDNYKTIDYNYFYHSSDKWVNRLGGSGFNIVNDVPEPNDLNIIVDCLLAEYLDKWNRIFYLLNYKYNPWFNVDYTSSTKGDTSNNKDTSYPKYKKIEKLKGGRKKTFSDYTETETIAGGEKTTYGDGSKPFKENLKHTGGKQKSFNDTDTLTKSGIETSESMRPSKTVTDNGVSAFNSATSGSNLGYPSDMIIGIDGSISVSTENYKPKDMSIVTSSQPSVKVTYGGEEQSRQDVTQHTGTIDDKYVKNSADTKETSGSYKTEYVGVGDEPFTKEKQFTGIISDKYDNNSGSETTIEGKINESSTGTNDYKTEVEGWNDNINKGRARQYGEPEWEFRKHLFYEEVFEDIDKLITLQIY